MAATSSEQETALYYHTEMDSLIYGIISTIKQVGSSCLIDLRRAKDRLKNMYENKKKADLALYNAVQKLSAVIEQEKRKDLRKAHGKLASADRLLKRTDNAITKLEQKQLDEIKQLQKQVMDDLPTTIASDPVIYVGPTRSPTETTIHKQFTNDILKSILSQQHQPTALPVDVVDGKYQYVRSGTSSFDCYGTICETNDNVICTGLYRKKSSEIDFDSIVCLNWLFFPSGDIGKASGSLFSENLPLDASDLCNLFSQFYGDAKCPIGKRVDAFLSMHRNRFKDAKLFMPVTDPMHVTNLASGQHSIICDINSAVATWLLKNHKHDVEFVDMPDLASSCRSVDDSQSTEEYITILNLSQIVRYIRDYLAYYVPTVYDNSGKSLTIVQCLRNQKPDAMTQQKISSHITQQKISSHTMPNGNVDFMHICDVDINTMNVDDISKYNKITHEKFAVGIAQFINQYTMLRKYLEIAKADSINQIVLMMNDFTSYSLVTAAVIRGFGLNYITKTLTEVNGEFHLSSM